MADTLVQQLVEAGVHYGHRASNWNPKMAPYIFGKRNAIHIIDVRQTVRGLILAKRFLKQVVAGGRDILFVGTKRQARVCIEKICQEINMPRVTERWLGGTLTNFRTIRLRLKRLEELERLRAGPEWGAYSKKMASQLTRELNRIHRNLSGIRTLTSLPGALVVVDVRREINALNEARRLSIPVVSLIDTDADPDLVDIPIPGNDDAIRAIEIVLTELACAITEGKTGRAQTELERKTGEPASSDPLQRRSSRARFRADGEAEEASPQGAVAAAEPSSEPQASSEAPTV